MYFGYWSMMLKTYLFLPLLSVEGVLGQALWQQVVRSESSDPNPLVTVFTFAEKPGLAQAESDGLAQAESDSLIESVHDKGVYVYVQETNNAYDPLVQIAPQPAGKFLVAPLPMNATTSSSSLAHAIEGFFVYGLKKRDGHPPFMAVYYTSAPQYVSSNTRDRVHDVSQNKFRVDLFVVDYDNINDDQIDYFEKMCQNSDKICIAARVVYEGGPLLLTNAVVEIMDGETGAKIDSKDSDREGMVYFTIPSTTKRVFAKAGYRVDAPGSITRDGERYDFISNYATTVLELTSEYAKLPSSIKYVGNTFAGVTPSTNVKPTSFRSAVGNVGIFIVGTLLLLSFFGGVVSVKLIDRITKQLFSVPDQEDEDAVDPTFVI